MRTNCDFLSIHDHQLLVDWIKGGVVWKTFQAIDGKKIIHACFAQFSGQTSGGEPTVCLLTTETLVVYPWQGPEMVIRLPDRPEKVNSLATGGLLLQLGDKSLYSLLNPFGHLQPIGFSRSVPPAKPIENLPIQPGSINDDATATSTVDSRWQIIHFDPASSLLIFIDPVEMTHYAWNIHADTSTSCVWKESCTNNVSIISSNDQDGHDAVCLLISKQTYVEIVQLSLNDHGQTELRTSNIPQSFPRYAAFGLPITRPNSKDLLLVCSKGSLNIWNGDRWTHLHSLCCSDTDSTIISVKNPKDSLLLFTLSNKTTVTVDLSIWPETNLTGKCFEEMRKLLPAGKYHYLLDKFYALKMTGNCADEWSVLTAAILALSDENDNFSSQPSVFAPIITALNSVLQFLEGQIVSYTDKVRIIGLLKHFDAAGCNFPPSRNRENLAVFVANNRHEKPSMIKKGEGRQEEIFPNDLRIQEVLRWLNFAFPVTIKMPSGTQTMSDQDILTAQQTFLLMAANRTLSQPTGYGMVLFKSISPPVAEPLVLSEFDLSGRIPGTKSVINFDPNILGQDYMNWPEFHRGTATALQISSDDGTATDCSWILFNRPNEPDAYHAGFLYGLGLTGHLVKLSYYQSFEYLNAKHDMTSVGLLLGLSASFIGTMNETITKLVSLHIPAFLPPYSTDLNLSSVLQSAALISMGLLYCESGHRRTAEIMASEIGRKFLSVSDINNAYRDGHALAAGFALGLTLLGKGSAGNIQLVDQLRLYINGGKMNFADPSSQECSNRPGVQALSNRFKDGNEVNTHITAGPSIIALGLMFIRSENKSVAALVETPDTAIMLENVRPDLLIIREISRNLIMWNSIRSEQSWLDSRASMPVNVPFTDTDYLRCCILSGACFAIGLRFAGSGIFSIRDLLLEKFDFVHHGTRELANLHGNKTCKFMLRLCMNTIAIACALVMAGTGDLKLLTKLRKLQTRIAMDVSYGDHMMIHMAIGLVCLGSGKMSVNNSNRSVAVLLCAFYPSFPSLVTDNRSHLQALRHLWVLSAEWRSLIVKDTESFESLQVPIEISLKDGSRIRRITPCILPPFDSIKSVILKSSKHLPARIESDQLPKQDFAWIVQRRAGCAKENEAGIAENPFSSSSLQCLEPVDVPIYDDEIIGFVDQQFPFQLLQFL